MIIGGIDLIILLSDFIQARREKQIEEAKPLLKKKARQKVKQKYTERSQNSNAGEKKQKHEARGSRTPPTQPQDKSQENSKE